jgi:hypothetical protein
VSSVVFKYGVPAPNATGRSFIDVPPDAVFLSVGMQDDAMFVWALVNPSEPPMLVMRRLIVLNTGQECPGFPDEASFLGTVATSGGIVWHVWDGDAS